MNFTHPRNLLRIDFRTPMSGKKKCSNSFLFVLLCESVLFSVHELSIPAPEKLLQSASVLLGQSLVVSARKFHRFEHNRQSVALDFVGLVVPFDSPAPRQPSRLNCCCSCLRCRLCLFQQCLRDACSFFRLVLTGDWSSSLLGLVLLFVFGQALVDSLSKPDKLSFLD